MEVLESVYRESGWMEGHYIDNHKKYECHDCGKHFIIGEKLSEDCPPGFPVCPYYGQGNVKCVVWTDDSQLAELDDYMGCLAICVDDEN